MTEAFAAVQQRVEQAAIEAGRDPAEITIMPVSKYHGIDAILACAAGGARLFGENRLQELREKHAALPDVRFAMIGPVQSNKVKLVVEAAAELHSLDSLDLAARLDRRLHDAGRRLPVLIQVNTSGEAQKSGIHPGEAIRFARELEQFEALDVQGLMTMAMAGGDVDAVRGCFRRLRTLRDELREAVPTHGWDELSMGMSGDFELAIAEGATMVRVGTAIFGPRAY